MTRLLTAVEVANLLRTTPDFVRAHSVELGGVRLGSNPRGPLRFTERDVMDYIDRQRIRDTPGQAPAGASRQRGRVVRGVSLLPRPEDR